MSDFPRIALMIGGAHKAGTTALFAALGQHPELCAHAPSEMTCFVDDEEHARGPASRAWRRYVPAGLGARVFVAKHVKLMYRRTALERLREHSPAARLVLVLRHPVERAHSAYWHARSHGREELASFEAGLAAEDERVRAGRAPWHDTGYVHNGLYAEPVGMARELFGDLLSIFLLEDLRARPLELCRALYSSLGVDARFVPDLERGANRATRARSEPLARALARVFDSRARWKRALRAAVPARLASGLRAGLVSLNTRALELPPIAAGTRARLCARFQASNARVAGLLGRDLSAWER